MEAAEVDEIKRRNVAYFELAKKAIEQNDGIQDTILVNNNASKEALQASAETVASIITDFIEHQVLPVEDEPLEDVAGMLDNDD